MVVLIIFPVILQTDINVIMLSIGGQGAQDALISYYCTLIAKVAGLLLLHITWALLK